MLPTLKKTQPFVDNSPSYGLPSKVKVLKNGLEVKLGPARFHLFEINTPNIEKHVKNVYKPNQKLPEDNKINSITPHI